MEHYLTQIDIKKVRHLSNVKIDLQNDKRQHLLLTGKNGSGKTSLLLAICKYNRIFPTITIYCDNAFPICFKFDFQC